MILSTCNRVEFLVIGDPQKNPIREVIEFWGSTCSFAAENIKNHVYVYQGLEAIHHLFTVASSLDSMILGEPQILGQLKQSYRTAVKHGSAKVIVSRALHKAFSVAKRVRTETAIASNAVSISYAAVELAKHIFGDLSPQRAMLVGAGEMAELAATHLLRAGIQGITVANRTLCRGEELADKFNGAAVPFESLTDHLPDVDIIISSTGSQHTVISARDIKKVLKKRRHRPMFFIDIAVPRDIDPDVNSLDNVYLYDIDDLKEVVEENLAERKEEVCCLAQIPGPQTDHRGSFGPRRNHCPAGDQENPEDPRPRGCPGGSRSPASPCPLPDRQIVLRTHRLSQTPEQGRGYDHPMHPRYPADVQSR
jgi:glutamyl-tRNA reductase